MGETRTNPELELAKAADIPAIYTLYEKRVAWMDQTGVKQWNVTGYLDTYRPEYFEKQRQDVNLFLIRAGDGRITGAVVLKKQDDRWPEMTGNDAYYVHNLVTDPDEKGLGSLLLEQIENKALRDGRRFLRLDCQVDNVFLNRYYESKGFLPAGTCQAGLYHGTRREKRLEETMDNRDVFNVIFSRSSYRGAFQGTPVSREDLTLILEAGMAAPSACNQQTTSFVAVDDPEVIAEIRCIFPKKSCQTAPAFILVFTETVQCFDGHYYSEEDFAAAIQNMLLAIKALGYESCWYEGNVRDCASDLAKAVGMPEKYRLVCLLPVGKAADPVKPVQGKKEFSARAWFNTYHAPESVSE